MIWRQPEPRWASSSDAGHDDRGLGDEGVGARRVSRRSLRLRGGIALTSIAFHADQLWFSAPGGIGTYVRELVPALERADPSISLTLFRSRWTGGGPPREWLDGRPIVEIPATIRSLYPRWNLLSRPRLPKTLGSLDVVHATNPAAIPPATTGQRLVVTVHDLAFEHLPELFERTWRALYRLGLRAAVKRADAIVVPSRATGDDLLSRTAVDPERLHVVPLAASLPTSGEDPTPALERLGIPSPYILSVGTLEP